MLYETLSEVRDAVLNKEIIIENVLIEKDPMDPSFSSLDHITVYASDIKHSKISAVFNKSFYDDNTRQLVEEAVLIWVTE